MLPGVLLPEQRAGTGAAVRGERAPRRDRGEIAPRGGARWGLGAWPSGCPAAPLPPAGSAGRFPPRTPSRSLERLQWGAPGGEKPGLSPGMGCCSSVKVSFHLCFSHRWPGPVGRGVSSEAVPVTRMRGRVAIVRTVTWKGAKSWRSFPSRAWTNQSVVTSYASVRCSCI